MQKSVDSVFACGNVVHVNDLVDNVTVESMVAGKYAVLYAMNKLPDAKEIIEITAGNNIRYICPQVIKTSEENENIEITMFNVNLIGFMSDIREGQGYQSIMEEWIDKVGIEEAKKQVETKLPDYLRIVK